MGQPRSCCVRVISTNHQSLFLGRAYDDKSKHQNSILYPGVLDYRLSTNHNTHVDLEFILLTVHFLRVVGGLWVGEEKNQRLYRCTSEYKFMKIDKT